MNYPAINLDLDTLSGMKPLRQAVFSLGSNLGDRVEHLQEGVELLAATPDLMLTDISSVYESDPVGNTDQPDFLNIVVLGETMLSSDVLLERVQAIEESRGRTRGEKWGPRTLDIDLIKLGERVRTDEHLTLPHRFAHERAFVLVPWLEADPAASLPGHGSVAELLEKVGTDGVRRTEDSVQLP